MGVEVELDEARTLAGLFTYIELKKLTDKQNKGERVTNAEKRSSLEASLEPFTNLVRGNYEKEDILQIIVAWKDFFSTNFPDTYHREISYIKKLENSLN